MFQQYFEGISWAFLPTLALVMFLGLFVVLFARLFVFKRGSDFDSMAALPLDDEHQNNEVKS